MENYLQLARTAAMAAYAPYSHFRVGAILVGADGRLFSGCNVENASFGLTICAERVAATRAIADGCRDWKEIYIVSPSGVTPCGACRQFLAEFSKELKVHISTLDANARVLSYTVQDLLPAAMVLDSKVLNLDKPS